MLLSWPNVIDKKINQCLLQVAKYLRDKKLKSITDIVPAYASLGVFYYENAISAKEILIHLETNDFRTKEPKEAAIREIPVCYDMDFGMDLKELCDNLSLTVDDIIKLHLQAEYLIFFIGFLPGFMYLGGLNELLISPRKAMPRQRVPTGSVGIGNNQTGIYPMESPGGWNIIGRCPLRLFDPRMKNPCKYSSGDIIRFVEIDREEYEDIYNREYSL